MRNIIFILAAFLSVDGFSQNNPLVPPASQSTTKLWQKDTLEFKFGPAIQQGAGAGKVLTSDAFGRSSWQTPGSTNNQPVNQIVYGGSIQDTSNADCYINTGTGAAQIISRDPANANNTGELLLDGVGKQAAIVGRENNGSTINRVGAVTANGAMVDIQSTDIAGGVLYSTIRVMPDKIRLLKEVTTICDFPTVPPSDIGQTLINTGSGVLDWGYASDATAWKLTGNGNIAVDGSNYLGSNNYDVLFKTQGEFSGRIGNSNTYLGYGALRADSITDTGINNSAIGANALLRISSGSSNSAFGKDAGGDISTGNENSLFGAGTSANANDTGAVCLGYGAKVGVFGLGSYGVALGYNAAAQDRQFYLTDSVLTAIFPSCKVGIGTTSPDGKFEIINPDTAIESMRIFNGDGLHQVFTLDGSPTSPSFSIGDLTNRSNGTLISGNAIDDQILFQTNAANTGKVIIPNGNVGIGTATPGATLDVFGTFRVGNGTYPTLLAVGSDNVVSLGNTDASATFDTDNGTVDIVGNTKTTINVGGGNVGIGFSTPGSTLTVGIGDIEITTPEKGLVLHTPTTNECYRIWIDDGGQLQTVNITCP